MTFDRWILFVMVLPFFLKICHGSSCLSLPQNTPSQCQDSRNENLVKNQAIYSISRPPKMVTEDLSNPKILQNCFLFPLINMTLKKAVFLASSDTREREWFQLYAYLQETFLNFLMESMKPEAIIKQFHNNDDFKNSYTTIRNLLTKNGEQYKAYFKYPSTEGFPFQDIIDCDHWKDDIVFVEQRLAALNPMSLQKLTQDNSVGVNVLEIKKKLNPKFDWDKAVSMAIGKPTTLLKVVQDGSAFITHFPYLHNLTNVDDLMDFIPTDERKIKKSTSPIALFVSTYSSLAYQLKPVAIQIDNYKDSPVYTPQDGQKWLYAKEIYEVADFAHVEIVEHLLKTHVVLQPICVIAKRTLSEYHPLGILLKQHCRGLLVTNINGLPKLVLPQGYMHRLFSIGNVGAIQLLNKGYAKLSWEDTDFMDNLRKRGVTDKKKLPFFPYRDDGKLIWDLLKHFTRDYVKLYYHDDTAAQKDNELLNFANELSSSGTGKYGGIGMLKGFPSRLTTIQSIVNTFTRILWLPIQHNTVNYPISYYGAFVPNLPTRLYDDPRATPDSYSFYHLPNQHVATVQSVVAMSLGSLRYDKLLDYSSEMEDDKAAALVEKYYNTLMGKIKEKLEKTNKNRFQNGHLTYPYLVPGWIPNSLHT